MAVAFSLFFREERLELDNFINKSHAIEMGINLSVAAVSLFTREWLANTPQIFSEVGTAHLVGDGLAVVAAMHLMDYCATAAIKYSVRFRFKGQLEAAIQEHREVILKAKELQPTGETLHKGASHNIFGEIYLGNYKAFQRIQNVELQKSTTVITACSLNELAKKGLTQEAIEQFQALCEKKAISWLRVGNMLKNGDKYWAILAYNCTYPDSKLASLEGLSKEAFSKMWNEKAMQVAALSTDKLFQPIFNELDQALIERRVVLVHGVKGRSRSATILAAYIINRFKVPAAEALVFLKSKSVRVEPKFIDFLQKYENRLSLI